jgi:hypothetical protein
MSYGAITDPRLTEPGMGEFHFAHNGGVASAAEA